MEAMERERVAKGVKRVAVVDVVSFFVPLPKYARRCVRSILLSNFITHIGRLPKLYRFLRVRRVRGPRKGVFFSFSRHTRQQVK